MAIKHKPETKVVKPAAKADDAAGETKDAAPAPQGRASASDDPRHPGQGPGHQRAQQEMTHQRTLTEIGPEQRVNPKEADDHARATALPPQSSRPGVEAGVPLPGAGLEANPETSDVRTMANAADVRGLPIGTKFYVPFLHKPKSDDDRYIADRKADLISGKQTRRGISSNYWQNHSTERPPLAERTNDTPEGYRLLD